MITMRPSAALALTGLALLAIAGCGGTTTVPASAASSAPVPASSAPVPASAAPVPASAAPWPVTRLHYAPNSNYGQSGEYLPGADGFNLADIDVHSKSQLDSLPAGLRGLVYIGTCGGATASFRSAVDAFAGDPRLFGRHG